MIFTVLLTLVTGLLTLFTAAGGLIAAAAVPLDARDEKMPDPVVLVPNYANFFT